MYSKMLTKFKLAALSLLIASLLIPGLNFSPAQAAPLLAVQPAPAAAALAALPATPCTSPAAGTSVCNLWAKSGTLALPGTTVNIYGYAAASGAPAGLPGPVLIVNMGDVVTVNLTNTLNTPTALMFQGQAMIPDTTGVAAGATKAYTFTASKPGTYLYEAGLLANAQYQTAMGMYGALVVRPAVAGQAYNSAGTAFDDEALLVLSEVDAGLNNLANPAAFDLREYAPDFFLINGAAYPNTSPIGVAAGQRLLLRYVNAGLQPHSMTALGLNQTAIAMDGDPYTFAHSMAAETIAPGQTADAITTIPGTTTAGSKFPVYDGSLGMHNASTPGMGGMLTFIAVGSSGGGGDTTGPATSGVALTANPTNGSSAITLSALVSDTANGGSNIAAAEFYIDSTAGTANAMSATPPPFDAPSEAVSGVISTATLAGLVSGSHTIYVRGQDAAGNWGAFNLASMNLDKTGPATYGLSLTPASSNGTVNVALHATGDDTASGGSNIAAAEYAIDGGATSPLAVSPSAAVASLDATIPAATINALSQGAHIISARSQDALGNWGPMTNLTPALIVDKSGPATGNVIANPNPNNGALGFNSTTPAMRVTAAFTDTLSKMAAGEGFIDSVGVPGTGFIFVATDGLFNSPTESGYVDIPLTTINLLSAGNHTLAVRGKDSAGNWGAISSITLIIDKTRPVVSGVTASPNPTNAANSSNTSFTLAASATDAATGGSVISQAEWYEGADPGAGNGVAMAATDGQFNSPTEALTASINFVARGWTTGNHTLYVRARDAAGNWSTAVSTVVNVVQPNNIFADSFQSGNASAWSGITGANASVTAAASLNGSPAFGLQTTLNGTAASYVTDATPLADPSYHARFYFNPHGVLPANNNSANGVTIFSGLNTANTAIFQVQFRRQNNGTYQVRLAVLRSGGTTTTSWYTLANASQAIEIAWQSNSSASASLYIGGALKQTLSGMNTSAYLLDSVRLGPSAGAVAGASGTMYFDAFVSTRNTVVGP